MALTVKQKHDAIKRANDPHVFPGLSRITRLDGSVGGVPLTDAQKLITNHLVQYPWTYVVKSRQQMSSVVHILDLLRHIMYSPGQMGMLIGDKEDTYKELIRRMGVAYAGYPEPIRTPLLRPVSSESIAFGEPHNGIIQGITGGGENPAIGFSPDYAVISEYGLFQHYEMFDKAFWPAINRRPNARCRIETTPGRYHTSAHLKWVSSLAGDSAFKALFLEWWRDPTYIQHQKPFPQDFQRTSEEEKYAERIDTFQAKVLTENAYWYPYFDAFPIRDEQLWFRRVELNTNKTLAGDARLFDSQYPPTPYDGWLISQSPTIPPEPVERMLLTAHRSPEGSEQFYHPDGTVANSLEDLVASHPNMPFLITVDGKGYGRRGDGDPAAMTLWSLWDWCEVGTWSGDEDPGEITPRILRWQRLTNAHVAVETNKDGVAAALQQANCQNLWWSGDQPGWYATGPSKQAALIALVNLLRQTKEPWIFTWETLQQGLTWDGKTRGEETSRRKHHWDRWTTALIFAAVAPLLGIPRRPQPQKAKSNVLSADEFLRQWDEMDRKRLARMDNDRW